mmetsp:Transcript_56185/g.92937  ORF Transcript_56185/g.92937 Transcript_56185/m.92937 type:complete len:206 (-) Transcript_56185:164-781(-)
MRRAVERRQFRRPWRSRTFVTKGSITCCGIGMRNGAPDAELLGGKHVSDPMRCTMENRRSEWPFFVLYPRSITCLAPEDIATDRSGTSYAIPSNLSLPNLLPHCFRAMRDQQDTRQLHGTLHAAVLLIARRLWCTGEHFMVPSPDYLGQIPANQTGHPMSSWQNSIDEMTQKPVATDAWTRQLESRVLCFAVFCMTLEFESLPSP